MKKDVMNLKAKLRFYEGKFNYNKDSSCILTISVGQANHEGERFKSTLKVINEKFNKCLILICDTLQRYNIEIIGNLTKAESEKLSRYYGKEWFDRNLKDNKYLTIECNYAFWDEWLHHKEYYDVYDIILNEYNNDSLFKKKVTETINQFYQRNKKFNEYISFDKIYQASRDYLLEECVVQILVSRLGYDFEIYPSQRNPILSYCYDKFIFNAKSPKLVPVSLKFLRKKVESV